MTTLLEVRDLYVEFKTASGRLKALNGIDFSLQDGEIYGLVGDTGCGKTLSDLDVTRR